MAISLTTINILLGSIIMVSETGVIMDNEMNNFSISGCISHIALRVAEFSLTLGAAPPTPLDTYHHQPASFAPANVHLSSISHTIIEKAEEVLYYGSIMAHVISPLR
jgi:gamma-glutamyltranspeptidase